MNEHLKSKLLRFLEELTNEELLSLQEYAIESSWLMHDLLSMVDDEINERKREGSLESSNA